MNTHAQQEALPLERLSDEQLGSLLSAVGNHENKALLSIAMQPGVAYSRRDLQGLFNEIQGDQPAWSATANLAFSYAMHSLAPIGLVAREIVDPSEGTVGFIKTDYGLSLGDSLAGHLLDYSLQHPSTSLQELFGRTGTSSVRGIRSPMGRLAIFGELLTQDLPARVSDLSESLDESAVISQHMHSLARDGLIGLENRTSSDPILVFALGGVALSELPLRPNMSELPSDIRDVLTARLAATPEATITTREIISDLHEGNPDYGDHDERRLLVQVNQAMRYFVKRGTVKNVGQFDFKNRSIVSLNAQQARDLEDCLSLVYRFQDGDSDFIEQGKQKAIAILGDQNAVKMLIAKARRASPFANRKSEKERGDLVRGILAEAPDATVKQIEEALIERDAQMSSNSVRRVLHELAAKGLVISVSKDKKAVWSLVDRATD